MAKYTELALTNTTQLIPLLHRVCQDKPGTFERVGNSLGLKYDTVYAQLTGVTANLPFATLRAAVFHSDHPELRRWYAPSGLLLVPDCPGLALDKDINQELNDIFEAMGKLSHTTRAALQDGRINYVESKLLHTFINNVRKEVSEVEALLRQYGYQG